MIELLKVYETLYLNDQQKILFKLIIKSKFSNNFFKSVRQAYIKAKIEQKSINNPYHLEGPFNGK